MREWPTILCLKRFFLCRLMAIVSLFAFHLSMAGEVVDSLYHVYMNADAAHKVKIVNDISQHLYSQEITDSLYQCKMSSSANELDAMLYYLMSEHYYDNEDFEKALEAGLQAEQLSHHRKADKFRSDVLGALCNAQFRLEDYSGALKSLLAAYQVDKKINNPELISSDLNSLSAIYLSVKQPEPGIHFIEKAIEMERQLDRPDRLATRLGLACELYLLNNDPDKAMKAIDEAYSICQSRGEAEKAAVRMVQKGAVLEHLGRLNEAHSIITKALPALEKANNIYSLALAHNQLGSIEYKLGNRELATTHYKKALEQSIRCGSPNVERKAEHGLWETMRESNPSVALIHLERYTALNDSLYNKTSALQLQVMETTIHDIEMSELDKKSKIFGELIKWGGLTLVVMLAAMAAAMFFSRRRSKKALHIQRQTQEMRSHFFTNITNELQTPLTVVMNAGQQLQQGHKSTPEENRQVGELIVKHGKSMLELVNQLLDIDKVRSGVGQPELKEADIVLYVKLLVSNYNYLANQKLITLDFSCPVNSLTVSFAPEFIRKIVHGLIESAIKFTDRNGVVSIKLTPIENDRMRLIVSDNGKGIPTNELERVFEPFTQSDNGDDGVETAVKLSLVNQIVQTIGGTITIDSEVGKGTTFTIEFPAKQADDSHAKGIAAPHQFAEDRIKSGGGANAKTKRLAFVVENNEDVAFFIANLLRDDFDLRFAVDGQEALQNAMEMVPDLIITNMMMPVMDGKQLMQQLRSTSLLNHIPIIALTDDTSDRERLACIRAGADAVLVKPFNSTELKLVANHLITQRSILRERYVKADNNTPDDAASSLSKEDKDFINRLVDVIHAQMSKDDINIDHIAAAMSLSSKQLRTRVMAITGLTPVAYTLQVRLNYARRMIASEDLSLTAIASKCGFQNLSHFSKAFKQQFGVSPLQFRKTSENSNIIP